MVSSACKHILTLEKCPGLLHPADQAILKKNGRSYPSNLGEGCKSACTAEAEETSIYTALTADKMLIV